MNRQVAAVITGDNCDRRPQLAQLKIPAAVIHGDADRLVVPDAGREVAAAIPGATLCIIPGMGHDISLKFVDKIVECMVEVMGKHRRE